MRLERKQTRKGQSERDDFRIDKEERDNEIAELNHYKIANFDSILLIWDFFEDIKEEEFGIESEKERDLVYSYDIHGERCKVRDNPGVFSGILDYMSYFFPLFLLECQQSIQRSKQIEMSEFESFTLLEVKKAVSASEDLKFYTLKFERKINDDSIYYSPQDLVLIVFDFEVDLRGNTFNLESPGNVGLSHVIGVVQGSSYSGKLFVNVLNPSHYLEAKKLGKSIPTFDLERTEKRLLGFKKSLSSVMDSSEKDSRLWRISRITSFATSYRELSGLFSLKDLPLKKDILYKKSSETVDIKYMKIPTILEKRLETIYNPSQMSALRECLKYNGISLIQGPPGTGKTTTIIGIISALLSSNLDNSNNIYNNKEDLTPLKKKKNGCVNDNKNEKHDFIGEETYLYKNKGLQQLIRAKPWCYGSDYVPWYDTEMRDLVPCHKNDMQVNKLVLDMRNHKIGPRKLLICAPSNAAIDAIVRKLIYNQNTGEGGILDSAGNYYSPTLVRAGPNFHPDLNEHSLEYKLQQRLERNGYDVKTCKQEIRHQTQWKILQESQITCATLSVCGSKELMSILNQTRASNNYTFKKDSCSNKGNNANASSIYTGNIIGSTYGALDGNACMHAVNNGICANNNQQLLFDTVIIDEASQGIELSTLIPLRLGCKRLILVGDPKQLPATVLSRRAIEHKYDISLFQRLQMSGFPVVMLGVQYRMHPDISAFPSKHFYDGELMNYENIVKTRKSTIPWEEIPIFKPFTFFSVNSEEDQGKSISNPIEAEFVCQMIELLGLILHEYHIKQTDETSKESCTNLSSFPLSNSCIKSSESGFYSIADSHSNIPWYERIAVISPYNEQVKLIKDKIREKFNLGHDTVCPIDVSTVDGFQGQEKDYIIFSVVRSQYVEDDNIENSNLRKTNAGFIADRRRINVALTRAKYNLWIVGNSRYLLGNPEWRSLWNYSCKNNCQFSVDFKRFGTVDNYLKYWLYTYLQRKEDIRNTLKNYIPDFIHSLTLDCSVFEKNNGNLSRIEQKSRIDSSYFGKLKEKIPGYETKHKKRHKLLNKNINLPIFKDECIGNDRKDQKIHFEDINLEIYYDMNEYDLTGNYECDNRYNRDDNNELSD
ncbi:SEN1 protein [Cryptosporidium ryanae]|uniref:SEN1 protein n=1 Tax=Cryptosporidium ryanae TaxID=515981 RepID=UPI003519FD34|nr:SEN1 protein [Cryptosporidium ryanae]